MSINEKIAEYVVEIRFKPNAKVLDKRGEIASNLLSKLLNQWSISSNQILLSSKENLDTKAVFSFKNVSFVSNYPNDKKFFLENAGAYIKSAWTHFPNNEIIRVGIRTKYLIPAKDFKSIFDSYRKNFLALKDEKLTEIGGTLIDLGFPLNFADGDNLFNIVTGPMEKKQFGQFVKEQEDIFENGVFIDFDYFKQEFSPYTKQKDIIELIKLGIEKAEKACSVISDLVIEKQDE